MSSINWYEGLVNAGALWVHDGKRDTPHVVLTSGSHSGAYFDATEVTSNPELLKCAVCDVLERAVALGLDISHVDGVAGPQTGATALVRALSEEVAIQNGRPCFVILPRKVVYHGVREMALSSEEKQRVDGMHVLVCDDVYTTGGSVRLVKKALVSYGGVPMETVLVLVNRSGDTVHEGRRIVALVEKYLPTWEPLYCPLCARGSRAMRPQKGQ